MVRIRLYKKYRTGYKSSSEEARAKSGPGDHIAKRSDQSKETYTGYDEERN